MGSYGMGNFIQVVECGMVSCKIFRGNELGFASCMFIMVMG